MGSRVAEWGEARRLLMDLESLVVAGARDSGALMGSTTKAFVDDPSMTSGRGDRLPSSAASSPPIS